MKMLLKQRPSPSRAGCNCAWTLLQVKKLRSAYQRVRGRLFFNLRLATHNFARPYGVWSQGFSLTELMVVVAVMGILLSISIPSFKKYQLQAYQSEAKTELSALYTAEVSFKLDWGTYYGNFYQIGYRPKGELVYVTGFHEEPSGCGDDGCWGERNEGDCLALPSGVEKIANAKQIKAPKKKTDGTLALQKLDEYYGDISAPYESIVNTSGTSVLGACQTGSNFDCSFVGADIELSNEKLGKATCVHVNEFIAGSVGRLKGHDKWTINQAKNLEHLYNGLQDDIPDIP